MFALIIPQLFAFLYIYCITTVTFLHMFSTPYNRPQPIHECGFSESQTIEGLAISNAEAFRRFLAGVPISNVHRGFLHDDDDDLENMDPTRSPDMDLADAAEMTAYFHELQAGSKGDGQAGRQAPAEAAPPAEAKREQAAESEA